jgi:hypothetical protein
MLLLLLADLPFDAQIRVLGQESEQPTLLDVSSFLYDFNLGYELARLATDPRYESFQFSHYALYRKGRPLKDDDRLRVISLSHQSPIDLNTILYGAPLAIGAIWGVVQIVEKISNWRLNREKLQEEIKKLHRENAEPQEISHEKMVAVLTEEECKMRIVQRKAEPLMDGVSRRLSISPVRIKEVEIHIVRRRIEIKSHEGK